MKVYCCQIRVRGVQGTNLRSSGSDLESKSSRLRSRDKHHAPGQDILIKVSVTTQFTEQEPTKRTWPWTAYRGASDYSEVGKTPPLLLDSASFLPDTSQSSLPTSPFAKVEQWNASIYHMEWGPAEQEMVQSGETDMGSTVGLLYAGRILFPLHSFLVPRCLHMLKVKARVCCAAYY